MSAISSPIHNPNETSELVSADADVPMEESGTSTIMPPPASSSQTSDTNQRGLSTGSIRLRVNPYQFKPNKLLAREQKHASKIAAMQAKEIKRLKSEISTNHETLQQFTKMMEEMHRKLDETKDAPTDADVKVSEALNARQRAEGASIEMEKRAAEALEAKRRAEEAKVESDKRAAEALEAKRIAEQEAVKATEQARMTVQSVQQAAEVLNLEKEQQAKLLSELIQQLKEKEEEAGRPGQSEDEVMADANNETNAALEDARKREEVLMNNVRKQEDLIAALKRQLHEKEKEKEDEPMMDDQVQPSVPKPMQPQRPTAGAGPSLAGTRQRKEPPPPTNFCTPTWEEVIQDTEFGNSASSTAKPSLETLDAKFNMLLENVLPALQRGNITPRRKAVGKDFKTPVKRVTNPDRNARNTWVRFQMNELIGIKKDEDIKGMDELILSDSPLNLQMAAFEKDARIGTPPAFKPMRPNLDSINGRWNDRLFDHFLDHCRQKFSRPIGDNEEEELLEIFRERIGSMRKVMKRYRPKEGESKAEATSRAGVAHLAALTRQRSNTRRNETFNTRFDITSAQIRVDHPDDEWLDNNTVVSLLGCEGMSSDESDVDDINRKIFRVKTVPWRNPILMAKLQSVDADRNTTNVYGNAKGGTPPRMRKRKDGRPSTRKPPTGKPINFYDPVWYERLTPKQKRDLDAKPAVRLMDNMVVE